MTVASDRRLRHWAWWLTGATIGWNSLEAVVAIVSGLIASSIALVGFGLDSLVQVSSAGSSSGGSRTTERTPRPVIPTFQADPHFSRIYAAYGGMFVVLALSLGEVRRRLPPRPLGPARCHHLPGWRAADHVRAAT